MWVGAVLLSLAALLGAPYAAAATRWEIGPKVERGMLLSGPLSLADGRVLVCQEDAGAGECEMVDPVSGEREAAPLGDRAKRLAGALSLDDGSLLLPHTHESVALRSGSVRGLPPAPRKLSELRGIALAGGRAAFVSSAVCERVLLFLGFELGFRDVKAAPAGTCVQDLFDLGDGRVLIARTTDSKRPDGGYYLDFVVLTLRDLTFQAGPRIFHRLAFAAFVHRGEIVVLLRGYERNDDGTIRCEALFLDRNLKRRQLLVFAQGDLGGQVARIDGERVLLFDGDGSLLWRPTRGSMERVTIPAATNESFVVLRRDGVLSALFRSGQTLLLRIDAPPANAPCRDVFAYAQTAIAEGNPYAFHEERVRQLMSPLQVEDCRAELDRDKRFPDAIQVPLDALLARTEGTAADEEIVAANVLCTLIPNYGVPLIERILSAGHLDAPTAALCDEASELHPVLAAVGTPRASRELLRYGLREVNGRPEVRASLPRLLERRRDLAHDAGPLLTKAHEKRARGFDQLKAALCPGVTGKLEKVCDAFESDEESDWLLANPARPRILLNLGIATGVIGGLTTLAYFTRNNDGGRAIAIGSGIIGGGTLGAVGTFALSGPGGSELQGLGTILLAIPITIGSAVAGGAIASHTSRKPGGGRFATAAVPLGGVWLTGVGLTINAW